MKAGKEFIEKTKYANLAASDQQSGKPAPPLELACDAESSMDLPREQPAVSLDLTAAIGRRQSVRNYQDEPLSLSELSYLLWCTQGVKQTYGGRTSRTVPSAGGRHALETWLVVNKVAGLTPGLYRYSAVSHRLTLLTAAVDGDIGELSAELCRGQQFVTQAAALFIWVAVPYRMTWRYNDRGYRYLFLDAGHVCQNLYLAAEGIGAGVCAIAAYDDDRLNAFLGLDGENAFAVYLAAAGKRQPVF
ncbi:MAG: SagB/ThcOx family dehydrogenase [Sporomusaceae bacterium]|nr:SagB/ThcOx family dehydrogenase [Sporomusaceae bacterium]